MQWPNGRADVVDQYFEWTWTRSASEKMAGPSKMGYTDRECSGLIHDSLCVRKEKKRRKSKKNTC